MRIHSEKDNVEISPRPDSRAASPAAAPLRIPLACALVAIALAFAAQWSTVQFNYRGNWTALFCTGGRLGSPPELALEHIFLFTNSYGWDGQYYHYEAHDPLMRTQLKRFIDGPRLRYRRILIPALAHVLALGRQEHIDHAYRAVVLAFVGLGAFWLSRLAMAAGRAGWWGLAFLGVPATITALDRMVVDIAVACLFLGFIWCVLRGCAFWKLYVLFVAAALARDTGILLPAGYALWLVAHRRIGRAALTVTAALPALAWYAHVNAHTQPYIGFEKVQWPFAGIVSRIIQPLPYPESWGAWKAVVIAFDEISLAGMLLAFLLVLLRPAIPSLRAARPMALLLTAIGLFLWMPGTWETYDFGRIFSPLLLYLALEWFWTRRLLPVFPLFLIVPRMVMQTGGQIVGVLRGLI